MRVLGLDPATHCGWAILEGDSRIASGVWDLSLAKGEGDGVRVLRMHDAVFGALEGIDLVAYEKSANKYATGALIYGALVGAIQAQCETSGVPYVAIHWATVKRVATGKGNANKAAMVAAANERFAPHVVKDDNEADALWTAVVALAAA